MLLRRYVLFDLTFFNNCEVSYLINRISLIKLSLCIKSENGKAIKAGISFFPIFGKGINKISKMLIKLKSPKTVNLTLKNIIIVLNFYINIVSKTRLLKKSLVLQIRLYFKI